MPQVFGGERQNGEGMRGNDSDPVLDVSGTLPSGRTFKKRSGVQSGSACREGSLSPVASLRNCSATLWGAQLCYADHLTVEQIIAHSAKNNFAMQEINPGDCSELFFQTR
jgi:hypothetical protein